MSIGKAAPRLILGVGLVMAIAVLATAIGMYFTALAVLVAALALTTFALTRDTRLKTGTASNWTLTAGVVGVVAAVALAAFIIELSSR
jgi:hypothetical protein